MILTPSEPDLRTIVQRIDEDDIDLQPEFQRQEVWSTPKKRRLIDTILRGWSIPPVHLVQTDGNRLEVLDGQQRLTALRDFVHNRFSIDGRITPENPSVAALHGKFYRELDPATRRRIDQYPLRCFRISDYLPEEPSELFYRLNQPTALTAGEQRNALFGPAREQLKSLVLLFVEKGNSKESIAFSNARLAYDDIIARLLFFLEHRNFGLKSTETRVSDRFRESRAFDQNVMAAAQRSIDLFSAARASSDPYRFNKASVLSFLLFFSRFAEILPNSRFLQTFINASSSRFTAHYVTEAADLFEDRASLRVTDVSSVVYRDFALWYIYYFVYGPEIPKRIRIADIVNIEDALKQRDDATFEFCLSQLLNQEYWAATL